MNNITVLVLSIFFLISCEKKKCISNEIEKAFIQEYFIETDSCDLYKGYPRTKYFKKEKILMSGFSKRNEKQGEWNFYNEKGDQVSRTIFKDSQPVSISNFNSLDSISWKVYNSLDKKYLISVPENWVLVNSSDDNNSVGIVDESVLNSGNYNFKLVITSLKIKELKESITSLYKRTVEEFKEEGVKDVINKQISIDTFNEVYEIKYKVIIEGIEYLNRELFYSYKDRFYLLSFSKKNNISYDYSIIEEILDTSFKIAI
ncbi:hypothetical protein [uncultured Tenacibaculum sp.]|uniref:hypothetical protein n=1 Tax=uncultured Tenacibaculum sp. TaxID=174713 RepID=UPI00262D10CD|nr:hypothetical protein [uncultured Tenacibaculum sp.]